MDKKRSTLVFNKLSGEYIASMNANGDLSTDLLNHDNYNYRTVEIDEATQVWSGDYGTGTITNKAQVKPVVLESELDAHAKDKVFGKYQYYHQINVLAGVVQQLIIANQALVDKLGDQTLSVSPEHCLSLCEMQEYITSIRANNERYKAGYIESADYEYQSSQDEADKLSRQLDGGLHELFGRAVSN